MSKNYLSKNDELRKGDYLISNNGQWKAVFQEDGNFVLYGWKQTWSSETSGCDALRLCMQPDCNLVMYNKAGVRKWHTNSSKPDSKMCRLRLTDDGKLVVNKEHEEVWSSANSKGTK